MDFARARVGGETGAVRVIGPGSLVIVFLHHDELDHVYMKPHEILNNKWGAFHHDDLLGQPYGSTWKSRIGRGWLYALAPTPELWANALPHRTQIVHELDAAVVVLGLGLKPGHVVVESGTGSGAMSTTIMRTIAPSGHLHTFEFNGQRAAVAAAEFRANGLEALVTVTHRDVCGKGSCRDAAEEGEAAAAAAAAKGGEAQVKAEGEEAAEGGFLTRGAGAGGGPRATGSGQGPPDEGSSPPGSSSPSSSEVTEATLSSKPKPTAAAAAAAAAAAVTACSVDGVFLDLPEPWLAVPHARTVLKPGRRVCSYSPCIEQTMKTCTALREHGFHSVKTVETRLKTYDVRTLVLPQPDFGFPGGGEEGGLREEQEGGEAAGGGGGGEGGGGGAAAADSADAGAGTKVGDGDGDGDGGRQGAARGQVAGKKRARCEGKAAGGEGGGEGSSGGGVAAMDDDEDNWLVAKPIADMRGHTAFLTFATRGVEDLAGSGAGSGAVTAAVPRSELLPPPPPQDTEVARSSSGGSK